MLMTGLLALAGIGGYLLLETEEEKKPEQEKSNEEDSLISRYSVAKYSGKYITCTVYLKSGPTDIIYLESENEYSIAGFPNPEDNYDGIVKELISLIKRDHPESLWGNKFNK